MKANNEQSAIPARAAVRVGATAVTWLAVAFLIAAPAATLSAQGEMHGMVRSSLIGGLESDPRVERTQQTFDLEVGAYADRAEFLVNPVMEVREASDPDILLREAYVDLFFDAVDVRVGKQSVIWGEAEGAFITDIVSPRDLSDFILPDFREIRMGIPAVKIDWYTGQTTTEVVWVPRFVPTTIPEAGSEWYVAPQLPDMGVTPTFDTPDYPGTSLSDSELFAKVSYFGSALDFEVMGGYAWSDEPQLSVEPTFSAPGVLSAVEITPRYDRFVVAGGSASTTLGSVILRGETAAYFDRAFTVLDPTDDDGLITRNQFNYLAGVDWSLLGADFSVQWIQDGVIDYTEAMVRDEFTQMATFRARDSFISDRLTVELFAYLGIDPYDTLVRPSVAYELDDGVEITLEGNFFAGDEEGTFGQFDDRDLVLFELRYFF